MSEVEQLTSQDEAEEEEELSGAAANASNETDQKVDTVVKSTASVKKAAENNMNGGNDGPQQRPAEGQVTDVTDTLKGVSGDEVGRALKSMFDKHGMVMISKTYCPFSNELKRTLAEMRVSYYVVEIDLLDNMGAILDFMKDTYNYGKTVPQTMIDGKHYGGCDDFKALQTQGKAMALVRKYIAQSPNAGDKATSISELEKQFYQSVEPGKGNRAMNCLFAFPAFVNNEVIRLVGLQVFFICILGLIFRNETEMKWVIFGLFIDYCCRFTCGAAYSPIGLTATILVSWREPVVKPGPPKQFAAFCGVMFSGGSALLLLLDQEILGSIVLGILLVCAGMEGILDFCVGCYFFGLGGQFGIVSKAVYKVYTNTREETVRMITENLRITGEVYGSGVAKGDPLTERPTDLDYKTKTDESKLEDFDLIRHMKLSYFDLVLSVNGCGLLTYNMNEVGQPFDVFSPEFWNFFALFGIILYLLLLSMYIAKAFMYPSKVWKEWTNVMTVNSGASIFINLLMIAFFLAVYETDVGSEDSDREFAQFLWWFASSCLVIMTVYVYGSWIARPLTIEFIDYGWLMPGVGNLVSCIVAPSIPPSYGTRDTVWFLFAVGVFSAVLLMPMQFYRTVVQPMADDRRRNGIMLWIATPAAIVLAYQSVLAVNLSESNATLEELTAVLTFSDIQLVLYFISIFMVLVLGWSMITMWLGRAKFGESYYAYVFPMALISVCSLRYVFQTGRSDEDGIGNRFTRIVLCYPFIGATLWFCCVNLQWTVISLVRKRLFRPMIPKWGVLSFMRLTHFAFHNWMDLFEMKLSELESNGSSGQSSMQLLREMIADWNIMKIAHEEHSSHEDAVIFPEAKLAFPKFSQKADDEHIEQHHLFEQFDQRFEAILSGNVELNDNVMKSLISDIRAFLQAFRDHLKWEEDNMQPVLRKYTSNGVQVQILRRVFLLTSFDHWQIFIPWVLRNQYRPTQRVTWLKTLCWAMPERAQTFGLLAYRGVSDTVWAQLTREIPEIIPRGLPGWRRQL